MAVVMCIALANCQVFKLAEKWALETGLPTSDPSHVCAKVSGQESSPKVNTMSLKTAEGKPFPTLFYWLWVHMGEKLEAKNSG